MEIKMSVIGKLDFGIDGADEYVLISRLDDELTERQAYDYLMPKVYRDCSYPGGYFCTSITIFKKPYVDEFIGIVHHRYDN